MLGRPRGFWSFYYGINEVISKSGWAVRKEMEDTGWQRRWIRYGYPASSWKEFENGCTADRSERNGLRGAGIADSKIWRKNVTHATDSTTKREVGQFSVSGIHIPQNIPFPLPLIPVCGETTDIAMQCKLLFEILAVVDNVSPEDLYSDSWFTHHRLDTAQGIRQSYHWYVQSILWRPVILQYSYDIRLQWGNEQDSNNPIIAGSRLRKCI